MVLKISNDVLYILIILKHNVIYICLIILSWPSLNLDDVYNKSLGNYKGKKIYFGNESQAYFL